MSFRRRLDWSTSMRDYRASAPTNPMSAPLVSAGRFELKAIMRRAVALARTLPAGGKSWAWRMSVGLKSAWAAAKRELAERACRCVPAMKPARPLMARSKAQNRPESRAIGGMTFEGMCDSRAELAAHIARYEHRVA